MSLRTSCNISLNAPSLLRQSARWFFLLTRSQPHKIVKHSHTNRRLLPTNYLSIFDHFVGLSLKRLTYSADSTLPFSIDSRIEHSSTFNFLSVRLLPEYNASCRDLLSIMYFVGKVWFCMSNFKVSIDMHFTKIATLITYCNASISAVKMFLTILDCEAKGIYFLLYHSKYKISLPCKPTRCKFAKDALLKRIKAALFRSSIVYHLLMLKPWYIYRLQSGLKQLHPQKNHLQCFLHITYLVSFLLTPSSVDRLPFLAAKFNGVIIYGLFE